MSKRLFLFTCFALIFLISGVFSDSDESSDEDEHVDVKLTEAELEEQKREDYKKILEDIQVRGEQAVSQLRLSNRLWDMTELKELMNLIAVNPSITWLYMSECGITDEGAMIVAEMLKRNKAIKFLSLGDNKISDEGAFALANALEKSKTLKELWLNRNKIGDEGATALSKPFEDGKNTELRFIHLNRNKITETGALSLLKAWDKSETLIGVFFEGNNVGDQSNRRGEELYSRKLQYYEKGRVD